MLVQNRWLAIGYILASWMVAGVLITVHEHLFLSNYEPPQGDLLLEYNFGNNLIAAVLSLGIAGSLFAWMEIRLFRDRLAKVNFIKAILIKVSTYAAGLLLLLVAVSLLYNTALSGRTLLDPEGWQKVREFVFSISLFHPIGPMIIMAVLTSFVIQLSERLGPTELWKLLVGRYSKPKEEERIFMFLDLNQSTTLAEQLGNEHFHKMLNDFFYDIAKTIVEYKGEVVEYVGDLVVITWKMANGVKDDRCLKSFFQFESIMEGRREYYQNTYGTVPSFKAALHCGKVMVGEIGRIKKTLKFTGDVLNTSARIEKVAGNRGIRLAISGNLAAYLSLENGQIRELEDVVLRGKQEVVKVYEVTSPYK